MFNSNCFWNNFLPNISVSFSNSILHKYNLFRFLCLCSFSLISIVSNFHWLSVSVHYREISIFHCALFDVILLNVFLIFDVVPYFLRRHRSTIQKRSISCALFLENSVFTAVRERDNCRSFQKVFRILLPRKSHNTATAVMM